MNKVQLALLIIKIVPCIIAAFNEVGQAKENDGKVDIAEAMQILENLLVCVKNKVMDK